MRGLARCFNKPPEPWLSSACNTNTPRSFSLSERHIWSLSTPAAPPFLFPLSSTLNPFLTCSTPSCHALSLGDRCLTGGHSMACAGKCTNTNVLFFFFLLLFSVREKWGSHAGLSSLLQSEPCLTQTSLDRRAPCHVHTFSTVFTCYTATHLCFVPTH